MDQHIAQSYHDQGYVIIKNIIDYSLIKKLCEEIEKIQSNLEKIPKHLKNEIVFERELKAENRKGIKAEATENKIFILGDPPLFNPIFGELLEQKFFFQISKILLNTEKLIYHFMNITIKQPLWGRSVNLHRDFPNEYICTAKSRFFRALICLDRMNKDNGAISIVKGSHLIEDEDLLAKKIITSRPDNEVDLETIFCSPGEMLVLHPKICTPVASTTAKKFVGILLCK